MTCSLKFIRDTEYTFILVYHQMSCILVSQFTQDTEYTFILVYHQMLCILVSQFTQDIEFIAQPGYGGRLQTQNEQRRRNGDCLLDGEDTWRERMFVGRRGYQQEENVFGRRDRLEEEGGWKERKIGRRGRLKEKEDWKERKVRRKVGRRGRLDEEDV